MAHYNNVAWVDIQDALAGIPTWPQVVQEVASVTEGIVSPNPNPTQVIIGARDIVPVNGLDGNDLVTGGADGDAEVTDAADVKLEMPKLDLTKNEVAGNIFSYMYLVFAAITIGAAISMVFFAWFDVRKLGNYVPSARATDRVLMFVDTMEHRLLKQDPRFNVFVEHLGPINIIMSMGVNMLSILLLQVILGILIKVALDGGDIKDVIKAFNNPWIIFVMVLFVVVLVVALVYYFVFNRNRLNKEVVGGVFESKLGDLEDLQRHLKSNIYNAPDNIAFYQALLSSVRDHGRNFKDYVAQQASIPRSQKDLAKMMFTFNVFNYYFNQYNTVESFMATPVYKYFDGLPVNSPDFDLTLYVNVLTLDASNGVPNVFDANMARSYYNRTTGETGTGREASHMWETNADLIDMMSNLNAKLKTMYDFNWKTGGSPSAVFMAFKRYLRDRLIFWVCIVAAIVVATYIMVNRSGVGAAMGGMLAAMKKLTAPKAT